MFSFGDASSFFSFWHTHPHTFLFGPPASGNNITTPTAENQEQESYTSDPVQSKTGLNRIIHHSGDIIAFFSILLLSHTSLTQPP